MQIKKTLIFTIMICGFLMSEAFAQVDIVGPWGTRRHEDGPDRGEGPEVGDYAGLPITDEARFQADAWTATKWAVLEHQCEPHPAD